MQIETRRRAQIIRDLPSARLTLTSELLTLGVDIERDQDVWVSVVTDNGRRYIVIEKVEK